MSITRIFIPAPAMLRGFGVLLAFRFISDNLGMNGVIEYSFVGILSSVAVTLSAGGTGNYLVGLFARIKLFAFVDLYKIGQISLAGLLLLLVAIGVSLIFSRVSFVFPVLLWVYVIFLVYIFASVATFCNSYFTGVRAEKILVFCGVLASVLYILGLVLCYFVESVFLTVWAVLGFHLANGVILFVMLLKRHSDFSIVKKEKGLIVNRDMINVSMMSLSSAISNAIFMYGWLNGRGDAGETFTVDLISMFRLTDVATMLVAPFVAMIVYPRLCGWSDSVDGGEKVLRFFLIVFSFSILTFSILFLFRDPVSEMFFGRVIELSYHLVIIFMLGESMRLALSVFGYAFIDGKDVAFYYSIEIFVKIFVGMVVYMWANVLSVEVMFLFYLAIVLMAAISASYAVKQKAAVMS